MSETGQHLLRHSEHFPSSVRRRMDAKMRASLRSTSDTVAYLLSVWFGCGLVPRAPGTAGTIGALPVYLLLRPFGAYAVLAGATAITIIGLWSSHRTSRRLGQKDPQIVCIDEVAGVMFTWASVPYSVAGVVVGFVLFRVADVVKPWPARAAERRLPGGFGIMLDDLCAAGWSVAMVLFARWLGLLV